MAKYKATCNFLIDSTDQSFDEGTVYELTTAEAEEINQASPLVRNGWNLFLIANPWPKRWPLNRRYHGILNT